MANDIPPNEATLDLGPDLQRQDVNIEFVPDGVKDGGADMNGGEEPRRGARETVRAGADRLSGQAGDKLRAFADDGKSRATGALDEVAKLIGDAAGTIDEKVGGQFGGYARNASTAVSDFAESLRGRDIDELAAEAREFVRKSPAVAIGGAAAIGFLLARVLRSGVDNRGA